MLSSSSSCSLQIEDVFIQVRDKLNKENVKLWLEPYYYEGLGPSDTDLKSLSEDFGNKLKIPIEQCYAALSELQTAALEKLRQRNKYKESGIASFKIKLVVPKTSPKISTQEILLSSLGSDLKNLIAQNNNGLPPERLKLISNGIVIKDDLNLSSQGLKNGQQILAILLIETEQAKQEFKKEEEHLRNVEKTKEDASLLLSSSHEEDYLQLEDQQGNAIYVPPNERKALMLAMTLHEKGKKALKEDNFALALIYFLDADKEFSQVNSKLLNSVDNYALLDLDIAWCYLCLQSLVHLPEASRRLKRCEERFHQSYGKNLERLIAVKGTQGNEAALFMRLHLLQAIVFYHENERNKAQQLLIKAQAELSELKVDEGKLISLVELGFSTAEARLGLRATHGDVNLAANYINENRHSRMESRRKAAKERILQREKMKLGLCDDKKQYVEPNFVRILVNMGYSHHAAKTALKKCNNIITDSIQYITENPCPGPSRTKSKELLSLIEDLIPELVQAGFLEAMARNALRKHNGDVTQAIDDLLKNDGIVMFNEDNLEELKEAEEKQQEELKKRESAALERLAKDLSMVDDDHLDLTLEKEEEFLIKYLSLLK